jgi:uncharacterized protein (TIGR03435 family)
MSMAANGKDLVKRTLVVSVIVLGTYIASAQTGTASSGFEVASIRPSDPASGAPHLGMSPSGVFTAKSVTVKALVRQAYDLKDFQISGGPGWIDTDQYDIVAKGNSESLSEDQIRTMSSEQRNILKEQFLQKLRALLADRFQLKVHQETKELPIYALIIAKNGPKIQPATEGLGPGSGLTTRMGEAGKTEITGKTASLDSLVRLLSNQVNRITVDKTGLKGDYDFKMTFAPDLGPRPADAGDAGASAARADNDGPSIFTALQEQLGLKLEAQKGPVQVLVVDSVQKPSAN